MDVWEDSTGGDGGVSHESGEFLVVSDSKLDVSWDDSGSSVVSGGVTSELEDLGGEVLKDCGKIDWGTGSNSLGVSSLSKVSGDSSYWELESGSGGSADWSGCGTLSFSSSLSWHCIYFNLLLLQFFPHSVINCFQNDYKLKSVIVQSNQRITSRF